MDRILLFIGVAATTFVVGVWAIRGFPTHRPPAVQVGGLQPTLTASFGDKDPKDFERDKLVRTNRATQKENDPQLDRIRHETLQAATAYALSPCDSTMKQNLISALTVYTRMWQRALDCARPAGMVMFCEKNLAAVNEKFSTSLDVQIRQAMSDAFDQKGIVKTDFPDDVRADMLQFTGPGLWFDENPLCLPLQRNASRTR